MLDNFTEMTCGEKKTSATFVAYVWRTGPERSFDGVSDCLSPNISPQACLRSVSIVKPHR